MRKFAYGVLAAITLTWSIALASVTVSVNGQSYTIPQTNEKGWGTNVTSWIQAISSSALYPSSGTFTLTADLDFGATYGPKATYYKTRSSNLATAGQFRLANSDLIDWRNGANSANLALGVSSDKLQFNGIDLVDLSTAQTLTNKSIDADANTITNIENADIKNGANIARAKLASGTASHVLINDGSGVMSSEAQLDKTRGGTGISSTATFPSSGTIVTRDATETLTNKTIDADSNTITNIENADIKSGAAIARNKLASGTASHVLINDGSGVMSSEASLSISRGGTGQATASAGFDALSPNTTKGDITVRNSTTNTRLPVGSYGQVLTADSSASTGVKWATVSGGINYVTNGDAEGNATTGWATYADAAATPVDGTGGSPTATFAASSSSPLRGSYSFLYTPTATVGQGASYDFTIDAADKGHVLSISGDYSPTTASSTGYATGDMTIWIYDVTNATLIQPAGYSLQAIASGTQDRFYATFQTASNSTSYRVLFHQATTSVLYTMKFDNIKVGPQLQSSATFVGNWQSYTPTIVGLGTATSVDFQWMQDGPNIRVKFYFVSGTNTAVPVTISLPSGKSLASGLNAVIGKASAGKTPFSAGIYATGGVVYLTSDSADFTVGANGTTWANNTAFSGEFVAPIQGWSTSQLTADQSSEGRLVAARYATSAGQSIPNSGDNLIDFGTKVYDTHGAVTTGASWKFTAPVPGKYRVSSSVSFQSAAYTAGDAIGLRLYKNGSTWSNSTIIRAGGVSAGYAAGLYDTVSLNAGDYVDVRVINTRTGGSTSLDNTSTNNTWVSIERISGNEQVLAGETVAANYGLTVAVSPTANTVIKYDTKVFDTHNAYSTSTGLFTVPVAGKYRISVNALNGTTSNLYLKVNGTAQGVFMTAVAGSVYSGSFTYPCNAGDTLGVYVDTGGTYTAVSGSVGYYNRLSIERIGN